MLQAEIHLISDGKLQLRHFVELAVTVQTWVDYIHLRDKQCPACELLAAAQELLAAGMPATKLIISDRIDVALAAGAAGFSWLGTV